MHHCVSVFSLYFCCVFSQYINLVNYYVNLFKLSQHPLKIWATFLKLFSECHCAQAVQSETLPANVPGCCLLWLWFIMCLILWKLCFVIVEKGWNSEKCTCNVEPNVLVWQVGLHQRRPGDLCLSVCLSIHLSTCFLFVSPIPILYHREDLRRWFITQEVELFRWGHFYETFKNKVYAR